MTFGRLSVNGGSPYVVGDSEAAQVPKPRGDVRLTVRGTPAPKGSRTLGKRKDGTLYSRPASNAEHRWVEAVAAAAAWRKAQPVGPELSAPYSVELTFMCARPHRPSHPHPTRHDVDKLARAVLDGLVRGGLLTDDRHVTVLSAVKTWAAAPGGEGVFVVIREAPCL